MTMRATPPETRSNSATLRPYAALPTGSRCAGHHTRSPLIRCRGAGAPGISHRPVTRKRILNSDAASTVLVQRRCAIAVLCAGPSGRGAGPVADVLGQVGGSRGRYGRWRGDCRISSLGSGGCGRDKRCRDRPGGVRQGARAAICAGLIDICAGQEPEGHRQAGQSGLPKSEGADALPPHLTTLLFCVRSVARR
jgi:hypothetical protein